MALVKENYLEERVAMGLVPGVTPIRILGVNIGPTTTAEILGASGSTHAFPVAALSSPKVSSSSANDTAAGSGVRTITATGVNSSFVEVSETISMNGQTQVAVTAAFMDVNTFRTATVGTAGGAAAGDIYFYTGAATAGVPNDLTTVQAKVLVGYNQDLTCKYTVPAGKSLLIRRFTAGTHGSATAQPTLLRVHYSTNFGITYMETFDTHMNTGGKVDSNLKNPMYFPEKTQMMVSVLCAAGTAATMGALEGWVIDNSSNFLGI